MGQRDWIGRQANASSTALATNAAGELNVLGHDGDAASVDGAQVRVLKQRNEVGLRRLLKCENGRRLEPQIVLEVLCYFSHLGLTPRQTHTLRGAIMSELNFYQPLEWQFSKEQICRFLPFADLTKRHGARSIAVRFLDSTSGGRVLARCLETTPNKKPNQHQITKTRANLGGELLAWRLAASCLACGLLGASHWILRLIVECGGESG